jgi:hypothetical protein
MRTSSVLYVEYVDGERELYDLTADPDDLDNVYGAASDAQRDRLHASLQRMSHCHGTAACWAAKHVQEPTKYAQSGAVRRSETSHTSLRNCR